MKRGQGTFEYVLLLGGVLLIVVLAVVVLQGLGRSSSGQAKESTCNLKLAQSSSCYYANGTWKSTADYPVNAGSNDCVELLNSKTAGLCKTDGSFKCNCPPTPPG